MTWRNEESESEGAECRDHAGKHGDEGLVVQLEDMVRDESTHAEETERILRDWPP